MPDNTPAPDMRTCNATRQEGARRYRCVMPVDHVARGQQHVGQGLAWDDAPAPDAPAARRDDIQDDIAAVLRALGISDHARPISPHAVVQREVLPAIAELTVRAVRAEGETDAQTLREMADEMPNYAYYEALHQIANRLSPSTATVRDNASGIYAPVVTQEGV